MKKIIAIMMLVLMVGALCGCSQKGFDADKLQPSSFEGMELSEFVQLYIKQRTVTDETGELAMVLENSGDMEYTFDAVSVLEVNLEGKWYQVPMLSEAVTMQLLTLPAGSSEQFMFYIAGNYDTLPEGSYRVVKQLVDADGNIALAAAEFNIGR